MVRLLAPVRLIADLALPPRCPGCGAVTDAPHRFCATCWGSLRFIGPPWCAACALPMSIDHGADMLCAECQRDPPVHAGVRAAVAYGDVARRVALRLKYGRKLGDAETMARHISRLVPDDVDLLVPVPLHRWRLWSRGFNQALLIAQGIGRRRRIPVMPDALRRTRSTPPLRGLGRRQRGKAVCGVFAVSAAARATMKGKSIGLVDDVHTSGATADACTRALLRAGAARVTVLCWARVIDDAIDV
jgi:ComF family protein